MALLEETLTRLDPRLLDVPEGRRILTRLDPLAFALVYLRDHLRDENGVVSLALVHEEWIQQAKTWINPVKVNKGSRRAYIAPRSMGKSTWWQLIFPMWAAAHGHIHYIAAFSASAQQAKQKLRDFKTELDNNPLLRADYPGLCTPARRSSGVSDADRQDMYVSAGGFAFSAHGADSEILGMKVRHVRPDLLILDDIEPDESNYTPYLKKKRLTTVQDSILALNLKARVVLVGTVTMPGSIIHDLVKHAAGRETEPWIVEEQFTAHHAKPILHADDGTEYSVWPEKWSMEFLQSERTFRSFAKNFENDPMGYDGKYWSREDFRYGDLPGITKTLLQIDPAVTAKTTSDYTGLAVVGYSPSQGKVLVKHAVGVKLIGKDLRNHVVGILEQFPEIRVVRIEVNQGHDLWKDVFHHLPGVKVITHTSSASKEVRFAQGLDWWQRGRVLHTDRMPMLEEQAVGFPEAAYDDVIDATVAGVQFFLQPQVKAKAGSTVRNYM